MASGNGGPGGRPVGSELTEKQAKALDAIKDGANTKGVAAALGITQAGAHSHINALTKKGYLDKDGKLTALAVTGAKAPTKPPKDTTPPIDLSGDQGNGAVDAFALDNEVLASLKGQRDSLATTIGGIERAAFQHRERIRAIEDQVKALTTERDQHNEAISILDSHRNDAAKALDALPTPA